LAIRLETGRTHQIRVHFADRGHPLLGDPIYGAGRSKRLPAGPVRDVAAGLAYPALHAARLELAHPTTGEPLAFEAPLPPHLAYLATLFE
jgi:23S rRNA pseudouridine1911/1915/1917 synthase